MYEPSKLAKALRPREKIMNHGVSSLSDGELLKSILGSGLRGVKLADLAQDCLDAIDLAKGRPRPEDFLKIHGIGRARACLLSAALELGRRQWRPADMKVRSAADVWPLIAHFADRKQERFIVLSLNGANEVMAIRLVSVGILNRTVIHPREVFADPLGDRAASIVVAHNHPSGNLSPSQEDIGITRRLAKAGATIGIELLDHLIFSWQGYWSFSEADRAQLDCAAEG